MKKQRAPYALRLVRRVGGDAAIVYRRVLDNKRRERLVRLAAIGPLAFTAGRPLVKAALERCGHGKKPTPGPFYTLDEDWGIRVAGYALVTAGLRSPDAMGRACAHFTGADPVEAAWWLGLMTQTGTGRRARRALRILLGLVK